MITVVATVEMTAAECWRMIKAAEVGRVLYTLDAMPIARPVRFSVQHANIVFSVEPGLALKILRGGTGSAALQVDDLFAGCGGGQNRDRVRHGRSAGSPAV